MRITKVELKNIKNHAEGEWAFQPGVVAICGPNGAGKTTILESIAWALFDHLDYKRDDFVKRGTKRGQVTVAFISDLDRREYVVTRDTGGAYHVYDPETMTRLVEQKNQVVPWLRRHLGVDAGTDLGALFKTTIGVPQGAFTYDFTLPPSNRKGVFDQILKVEEYRHASDNLRETLRHLDGLIHEANRKLAEAEGELKSYDETKRLHDEAESRLKALESEQAATTAERERVAREACLLDELRQGVENERRAIEQLRVRLEVMRGSLASAREGVDEAAAAAEIVAAARAGYERYVAASNLLSDLEKRREARNELRAKLSAIERDLIDARSESRLCEERLREVADARAELAELTDKVERQNAIEAEIARLREGRGEAQSLRRSLSALDQELERLRRRYADLSRQIEAAGTPAPSAATAESLETERSWLDAEISQAEMALNNSMLKREHLETLRKDQGRLAGELEKISREIARLDPLTPVAGRLAEAEAERHRRSEELARLRAEVARDVEMVRALDQGGICPLLTEKCLNLKPGESLDSRFRSGLDARRAEIADLQSALVALDGDLKRSRNASVEIARLPLLQSDSARIAGDLESKRSRVAAIEEEIAKNTGFGEAEIRQLKVKRSELDKRVRQAREAEKIFSQAEILRPELAQVAVEGEAKKRERQETAQRVEKFGDIESRLAESEAALQSLNDPRGRAAALNQAVAREADLARKLEEAETRVARVGADLERANLEMRAYAELDGDITSATRTRAESERDYHAFISNEKIAVTLAAREQELEALSSEIRQVDEAHARAAESLKELEGRYDPGLHRRAMDELDGLRERLAQLVTQIEHTNEQYSRLREQLASLDEARERARTHIAEIERAERLRGTSDFIRDVLQKAAPYITESYLFSISIEANHLFREITGRHDVTLQWTREYEITIEEEGRERPFLNLSGGEQMAAALAVRLALLKELSEVNIAFFDEPTTNMDEERRRNLAQQIGRIKDFHQLFVISHDDSFEGYTDQIISLG
ncbi:MAG TPA: SMC family ATPase [Blastocatellia bacterium]|nr:SMC family ATPase [Blastocatellia bacterium]